LFQITTIWFFFLLFFLKIFNRKMLL
jgi:hypothetical protein